MLDSGDAVWYKEKVSQHTGENAMDTFNTLVDAIARTLFVNAYAQHCEDGEYNDGNGAPCEGCGLFKGHKKGHPQPGPQENWENYAPETPSSARDEAFMLLGKLEAMNNSNSMAIMYKVAEIDGFKPYADGFEFPEGWIEEFGHYLAMEALGHGVSWSDDHKDHGLKVPHIEYML